MNKKTNGTLRAIWLMTFILLLAGCLTVSDKQTLVDNASSGSLANRRVAVLPVKAQTSLAPDSVLPIRNELNKRIGPALQKKLSSSAVADVGMVSNRLNEDDALNTLEHLVQTYESTGIVDRKGTAALGQALKADFLVFSRLKAEKVDIMISKGMGTSLEVMIINANTGQTAWGGSGEWKRGGMLGFGGATPQEAAEQLISLALTSLPQATGQYHDLTPQEPVVDQTPDRTSLVKKGKKKRKK